MNFFSFIVSPLESFGGHFVQWKTILKISCIKRVAGSKHTPGLGFNLDTTRIQVNILPELTSAVY